MKKILALLMLTMTLSTSVAFADVIPEGQKYLKTCTYLKNITDFPTLKFIAAHTLDYGKTKKLESIDPMTCLAFAKWDFIDGVYAVDAKQYEFNVNNKDYDPSKDMNAYPIDKYYGNGNGYGADATTLDMTMKLVPTSDPDTYMHRYYKINGLDNSRRVVSISHLEDKTDLKTTSVLTPPVPSNLDTTLKADTPIFKDIPADSMYATAALRLKRANILKGYGDGTFKPDNTISRAEFTKIVIMSEKNFINNGLCMETYANKDGSYEELFTDVKNAKDGENPWYLDWVCLAKSSKIVNGYPDGSFKPNNKINYAEAAKIILKSQNLALSDPTDPWYKAYTDVFEKMKAVPSSIKSPGQEITRGEMILLMEAILGANTYGL